MQQCKRNSRIQKYSMILQRIGTKQGTHAWTSNKKLNTVRFNLEKRQMYPILGATICGTTQKIQCYFYNNNRTGTNSQKKKRKEKLLPNKALPLYSLRRRLYLQPGYQDLDPTTKHGTVNKQGATLIGQKHKKKREYLTSPGDIINRKLLSRSAISTKGNGFTPLTCIHIEKYEHMHTSRNRE